MSLYPILWAVDHAPVHDAEERAILVALVIKGDFDGCNCFRSYRTLGEKARVDAKTAGRRCREMEARGILKRQEEHRSPVWEGIPEKQRPVIWEVMIPAGWWGPEQLADINDQRANLGRPPLTRENRPQLPPAPEKKARTDKGTKRPKNGDQPGDLEEGQAGDPGTTSPGGDPGTTSPYPGDYKSPPQGLVVPQPSETPSESPSENNNAVPDAVGKGAGGFACAGENDGADEESSEEEGGCAASEPSTLPVQRTQSPHPRTVTTQPRKESPGFDLVRAAIPAAVAAPGTRLFPGLHRAINDLLDGAPGIPRRTPEQVIARLNRRWYGEHADTRASSDYRGCERCTPSGCEAPRQGPGAPDGCDRIKNRNGWLAAAIIAQDCPDPSCEDGEIIGSGSCRNCHERRGEARAAAVAAAETLSRWEANREVHGAAQARLRIWEEKRAAEEATLRERLGYAGVWGTMLDHQVVQHMAGWRDHNPSPAAAHGGVR